MIPQKIFWEEVEEYSKIDSAASPYVMDDDGSLYFAVTSEDGTMVAASTTTHQLMEDGALLTGISWNTSRLMV